jgi:hypothetical protein
LNLSDFEKAESLEKKLKIQLVDKQQQKYLFILLEADKFKPVLEVIKFIKNLTQEMAKKMEIKPPKDEDIDIIKQKILENNKNLERIYQELVIGQILTSDEFWKSQQVRNKKNSILIEIFRSRTLKETILWFEKQHHFRYHR